MLQHITNVIVCGALKLKIDKLVLAASSSADCTPHPLVIQDVCMTENRSAV